MQGVMMRNWEAVSPLTDRLFGQYVSTGWPDRLSHPSHLHLLVHPGYEGLGIGNQTELWHKAGRGNHPFNRIL